MIRTPVLSPNETFSLMKQLGVYALFCMGALSGTSFSEPTRPPEGIPVKDRNWMLPELPDVVANSTEIWTTSLELLEYHSIEPPDDHDPREVVWRLKNHLLFFIVCEKRIDFGVPLKELVGPGLGLPPEDFFFVESATYVVKHGENAWAVDLVLDKKGEFVSVSPLQCIRFLGETIYMPDGRENVRIYRGKGEALFEAIVKATGEDPRLWKADGDAASHQTDGRQRSDSNDSPAGNEEPSKCEVDPEVRPRCGRNKLW